MLSTSASLLARNGSTHLEGSQDKASTVGATSLQDDFGREHPEGGSRSGGVVCVTDPDCFWLFAPGSYCLAGRLLQWLQWFGVAGREPVTDRNVAVSQAQHSDPRRVGWHSQSKPSAIIRAPFIPVCDSVSVANI